MLNGFTLSIPVHSEAVIKEMALSLEAEEIIAFIKKLDRAANQWEVTLKLAEHFEQLRQAFEVEAGKGAEVDRETLPTAKGTAGN